MPSSSPRMSAKATSTSSIRRSARPSLDLALQHRVKPAARRHVSLDPELLLEKELYPDQLDERKAAVRVVVHEEVEVAVGSGLVPGRRPKQVERSRAHRLDGVGVPQQLRDGVRARHSGMITR